MAVLLLLRSIRRRNGSSQSTNRCTVIFILMQTLAVARQSAGWAPFIRTVQLNGFQRTSNSFLQSASRDYSNDDLNLSGLSVGDYVKGVHGGKYQFDAAGLNTAGLEFAANGYVSAPIDNDDSVMDRSHGLPKWAQRLGTNVAEMELLEEAVFLASSTTTSIIIQNQERTWEPFYVKIMHVVNNGETSTASVIDATDSGPFVVAPRRGKLAPRSGSPNPYQPDQPYLDAVTIQISMKQPQSVINQTDRYVLVAGTEEEKWYYRIDVSSGN